MKQYWPCAECKRDDGIGFNPLFTYDAANSLEAAMKQFSIWKYHYKYDLVKCWIDVYEDGKKLGTEEVWMDDIPIPDDYSGAHSHDCSIYFVSAWEQAPDSYTLEVVDGLWAVHETIQGVPGCAIGNIERGLMLKWKDEMAKYGFHPAPAYGV